MTCIPTATGERDMKHEIKELQKAYNMLIIENNRLRELANINLDEFVKELKKAIKEESLNATRMRTNNMIIDELAEKYRGKK